MSISVTADIYETSVSLTQPQQLSMPMCQTETWKARLRVSFKPLRVGQLDVLKSPLFLAPPEQLVYNHPLGQQVDLAFGGGLCFFLPNTSVTSCRTDGLDLIKAAHNKKKNSNPAYNVITTRKEFDALKGTASEIGTIGLFARDHMEYEIDRLAMSEREEEREPTLSDM